MGHYQNKRTNSQQLVDFKTWGACGHKVKGRGSEHLGARGRQFSEDSWNCTEKACLEKKYINKYPVIPAATKAELPE